MKDGISINTPSGKTFHAYVRCTDDSHSPINKPTKDRLKLGKLYHAYSFARTLNGGDIGFYIKDLEGNKVEAFEGIPTWRRERFETAFVVHLN